MYERDPSSGVAMSFQGWLHWHKVMVGLSKDPVADLVTAQEWALKSIDAGHSGQPHILYATASNSLGQYERVG